MSNLDLLTALPKPWSNISVNSIDTNIISGNPVISNIQGPLTISANVPGGVPILNVVTQNSSANNSNVGFESSNFDNSATISIVTVNQPSPATSIVTGGSAPANFLLTTLNPSGHVILAPGTRPALDSQLISPGNTLTTIQNIQMNGSAVPSYVPTTLNYYEEASSSFTFSGPWAPATFSRTISFSRVGRMVTLKIGSIIQTSGAASSAITASPQIPSRFIPTVSGDSTVSDFAIVINNGGVLSSGLLEIDSVGNISITASIIGGTSLTYGGGNFKLLSTVGFNNISISYSV